MPKLSILYLNNNKINDIYPLIQINEIERNFPHLYTISLKDNNLKVEDNESQKVIKTLLNRSIELDIQFPKKKYFYKS